jgi:perosamine synthetase
MAVHIYGLPVDMNPVFELAQRYGLYIIEDVAEVTGQTYFGKPCGSLGDVSVYSFYPNKHITTGEGGMLLTDDVGIAEKSKSLRNLCFIQGNRFVHEELGYNFRMTNLQAAVGVAQLEQLDNSIKKKRQVGSQYNKLFQNLKGFQLPLAKTEYAENIYWVYGLVANREIKIKAKEAIDFMAKRGIEARPFFWAMHEQPVFRKMGLFKDEQYPVAEQLARYGFYIPSGMGITDNQVEIVADCVRELSDFANG